MYLSGYKLQFEPNMATFASVSHAALVDVFIPKMPTRTVRNYLPNTVLLLDCASYPNMKNKIELHICCPLRKIGSLYGSYKIHVCTKRSYLIRYFFSTKL